MRKKIEALKRTISSLSFAAGILCTALAACTDEINDYEKHTPAEANNKVFISEQYASLAFSAYRTVEGTVSNMDTLIAKLVVNCTEPAGNDLSVKVNIDTLLVDVYNAKHGTSYHKIMSKWIALDKSTLSISEGETESDTLTISLLRSLDENNFDSTDGYIMPVIIVSASGYDTQMDYNRRTSYLTLDVTQENGVGFEEENNVGLIWSAADFSGYDLPLIAYTAPANDVNVELELDNSFANQFNGLYGTNFKAFPDNTLSLPSTVTWEAGSSTHTVHLDYTGTDEELSGNYLSVVHISDVTSTGEEPIKPLTTDSYYIILNNASDVSFTNDATAMPGVRQEDRSGYTAIPTTDVSFMIGNWESMFSGSQLITSSVASVTIDLGREYQNVTGVYLRAANNLMAPNNISLSYAGEDLYNDYPNISVGLGTVTPSGADIYIPFAQPINARYLSLNDMAPTSSYYSFTNFYIYTQN